MSEPEARDRKTSIRSSESLAWRKSSYSGDQEQCVELAGTDDEVLVRDSKNPDLARLALRRAALRKLVTEIKAGDHDLG